MRPPLSQSAVRWDGHGGQLEGGLQGPASGGERGGSARRLVPLSRLQKTVGQIRAGVMGWG